MKVDVNIQSNPGDNWESAGIGATVYLDEEGWATLEPIDGRRIGELKSINMFSVTVEAELHNPHPMLTFKGTF